MAVGPSEATLRDLAYPRGWLGLSQADHRLLQAFISRLESQSIELHTHVPIGWDGWTGRPGEESVMESVLDGSLPRRVDAALRVGKVWWLVECKPYARHYVLGQVLCYAYWWWRQLGHLPLARVIVVTDECDEGIRPVLEAAGVLVVELVEDLGGRLPHAVRDRVVLSLG